MAGWSTKSHLTTHARVQLANLIGYGIPRYWIQSMTPPPWFNSDLNQDILKLIWDRQIDFDPEEAGSVKLSRAWIKKYAIFNPRRINDQARRRPVGVCMRWHSEKGHSEHAGLVCVNCTEMGCGALARLAECIFGRSLLTFRLSDLRWVKNMWEPSRRSFRPLASQAARPATYVLTLARKRGAGVVRPNFGPLNCTEKGCGSGNPSLVRSSLAPDWVPVV
eukprot:scaffold11684_cov122-Isochrysis_galbana.AAC.6